MPIQGSSRGSRLLTQTTAMPAARARAMAASRASAPGSPGIQPTDMEITRMLSPSGRVSFRAVRRSTSSAYQLRSRENAAPSPVPKSSARKYSRASGATPTVFPRAMEATAGPWAEAGPWAAV